MEHRMGARFSVALLVEIEASGQVLEGAAVDLNLDGATITLKTGGRQLLKDTAVRLRFEPHRKDRGIVLPAVVTHAGRTRVGLMFAGYDASVEDYLLGCMSAAPEHACA